MIIPERIDTERLILRPFTLRDAADVFDYATNPEWSRFLPVPEPYTFADAETFIALCLLRDPKKARAWAIESVGKVIGCVELHFKNDQQTLGEMHWSISQPHWGKGLMTEAAVAVCNTTFSTFISCHRIYAQALPENVGSWRVMEKIGMQHEGTLRQIFRLKGEWGDLATYAILRPEWEELIN
ncbi:MAG: GNAT family N-acetyltransferase [Anaerolineae bacterium]